MPSHRTARTADLLHQELAVLIRREIKDPRVGVVSITHVRLSKDRRFARVFISPLGGEGDAEGMLEGLQSASGYLRRLLGRALRLRYVPELQFVVDDGISESVRMTSMLDRMARERAERESDEEGEE